MNMIRNALFILPLPSPLFVAAAPYDTLKFALRQQQITNDLRQKCQFPPPPLMNDCGRRFSTISRT